MNLDQVSVPPVVHYIMVGAILFLVAFVVIEMWGKQIVAWWRKRNEPVVTETEEGWRFWEEVKKKG